MPWQRNVLDGAMAERPDGKWLCRDVGLVVARQNGKGSVLEARQLAGLFLLGERLQVHTAHEFKTCYEHFLRVKGLIESSDEFLRQVKIIRQGDGAQSIELLNGNRIRFLARSKKSGRGFSGDVVYLDEAFELDFRTVGAVMPTLRSRPNPQIWYSSSAAHRSSEVLHSLRQRAKDGNEPRLFFAEWGNPKGTARDNREAWARANPSLGMPQIALTEETMADEMATLCATPEGQAEFDRELLGIPEEDDSTGGEPAIPVDEWRACTNPTAVARHDAPVSFGFSARLDRSVAFVVAAQQHGDRVFVEVVETRPGCLWLPGRARDLVQSWGSRITGLVVDRVDPAAPEIGEIRMGGQKVLTLSADQFAAASVGFAAKVHEGVIVERGDPALFAAVEGLRFKRLGVLQVVDRAACLSDPAVATAAICAVAGLPAVESRTATDESWAY